MRDSCRWLGVNGQLRRMNPTFSRGGQMRATRVSFMLLFVVLLSVFASAQLTPWNKLTFPPLPAFQPQEPTRIQLANGMVIFLQPDHELPLISATAISAAFFILVPSA